MLLRILREDFRLGVWCHRSQHAYHLPYEVPFSRACRCLLEDLQSALTLLAG